MARDYSTRGGNGRGQTKARTNGKSSGKSQSKKRGNTAKKNTRKKDAGTPRWVWVGCVFFISLTVAAVVYIGTRPTGHPGRDFSNIDVLQPKQSTDSTRARSQQPEQSAQQQNFAFYEMLPHYEVVIPGEMDESNAGTGSHQTASAGDTQSSAAADDGPENYIIQVGAFTNSKNASQLEARVTLLGLHARVIRSERDSGGPIYLVRSEVIDSNERLNEMLARLDDHDIETLVLQRSD